MRDERAYARWLVASGLAPTRAAPPELSAALTSGGTARLAWRPDAWPADQARWLVEGSTNGIDWSALAEVDAPEAQVEARPWLRVRVAADPALPGAGPGLPSDRYGATGDDWLVVDGFDRVLDGSWRSPTHDFAAQVGSALGAPFSTAHHEAVAAGEVALDGYPRVLWLLGDESAADRTFDEREQAAITSYLAGGGRLVVSGSEVGYATSSAFFEGVLGARYLADDAGTDRAGGYRFGVGYPEEWPDVLAGDRVRWSYATGGAAAVDDGQAVVIGFPLETLHPDDLAPALAEVSGWTTD
jgi:hypothetical protein